MSERKFIHHAVFYNRQNPEELTSLLQSIIRPVEIGADIPMTIHVPNDTSLESVKTLIGTKTSISVDGVVADVTVSWGSDTAPTYQQATGGTYVLDGDISGLPSNIKNTSTHKIKMSIVVAAAE